MRTAAAALFLLLAMLCAPAPTLNAQTPPQQSEIAQYRGLLAAAAKGDLAAVKSEIKAGTDLNARDPKGRTALMLAGYAEHHEVAEALIQAGADLNALEHQAYDLLTISSVQNDLKMVKLAIAAGADTKQITSPYEGTALIAAAHLGHVAVVDALIAGGAPLDHVNNLNWTALIEAIVLGDGGENHTQIVRALISAGADVNIPDGNGVTPLGLAMRRGYSSISEILKAAGAKP